MGQAKISEALGAGQYKVDYQYNVERIDFEIARLQLRRDDIDPTQLLAATNDLEEKQIRVNELAAELDNLIHNLNGEVSPDVIAKLQAADDALANADTALSATGTQISSAGVALGNSQGAFPGGPIPPAVTAAYTAANLAITQASVALGNESSALNTAQGFVSTALFLAQATTPDADAIRSAIQSAIEAMQDVGSAATATNLALGNATSAVSAAGGSLPGDVSWDPARVYAEAASFALTNSDTGAGPLGAQPQHALAGQFYSTANTALTAARDLMTPGQALSKKAITDKLKELQKASTARDLAQVTLDQLYLELANVNMRLDTLQTVEREKSATLWCADYTTEIAALRAVGTCEIPGQYGTTGEVVIRPGFQDSALDWTQPRDGFMTPCEALSPSGVYYNWAMRPGWQVYKPTYRFAKITKLNDDDTVDVEIIEPNKASDEGLNTETGVRAPIVVTPRKIPEASEEELPATKLLTNVAVEYMTCNREVFFLDDQVLVEFRGQKAEQPKVVGFRKEPRPCGLAFLTPSDVLTVKSDGTAWTRAAAPSRQYGNIHWTDGTKAVSWKGYAGRYYSVVGYDQTGPEVYYKGALIGTAPGDVLGCAIHGTTLLVICKIEDVRDTLFKRALNDTAGAWVELASYDVDQEGDFDLPGPSHEPWFFNKSATAAASSRPSHTVSTIKKLCQLTITVDTHQVVTGATFTIPSGNNAVDQEDLGSSLDDTCGAVLDPRDCETHRTTHTRDTYHTWWVDYVEDALKTIRRVEQRDAQFDAEYGPTFDDCSVGGGPAEFANRDLTDHQTWRYICEDVGLNLLVFDYEGSSTFAMTSFAVPDSSALGCAPYSEQISSASFTQSGKILEYLNISGGIERVVAVYRQATLTKVSSGYLYGPALGPEVPGFPALSDFSDTISGTLGLTVTGAQPPVLIAELPVNEVDATAGTTDGYIEARNFTEFHAIIKPSSVASDRTGHALVSSEKFTITGGTPSPLPETTLGGNLNQFVAVGLA